MPRHVCGQSSYACPICPGWCHCCPSRRVDRSPRCLTVERCLWIRDDTQCPLAGPGGQREPTARRTCGPPLPPPMRAPDILPAHHRAIGKCHAFLNAVAPRAHLFARGAGAARKNEIGLNRWSRWQLWRYALRRGASRQVQAVMHNTTFQWPTRFNRSARTVSRVGALADTPFETSTSSAAGDGPICMRPSWADLPHPFELQ